YLLYAYARIRRIFEKARERGAGDSWKSAAFRIAAPSEKTLALALLPYNAAVARVADTQQPHHLCQYLYDLAGTFSTFYDQCPVVDSPDAATRDSRLRLCDLTGRVLRDGLSALGIPTLERM
ncbi:MAG: arginine--tRNA ligase, partial [Phycisphaerae bacterium]|nr:arginine--tRNA ligase [Phycisphaerae bacterium]